MTSFVHAKADTRKSGSASRRYLRTEALVTAVIGVGIILLIGDRAYLQDLAILAIAYAFLAMGMYLPLALGGQLSLAYNAYFAIGAYAVALTGGLTPGVEQQLALWASIPAGIATAMVTAAILGFATRRLSGFHLAVATLMFGIAVNTFLIHSDGITGGPTGLGGIPRLNIFGWELGRTELVTIGIVGVWIVATLIARFRVSLAGIALRVQREAPAAAATSGVPAVALKMYALIAGAAIASLSGILFALMNQFVLPESFGAKVVFLVLFMPILGGMSTPWGAVLGAVLVVAFTFGFDFFQGPGALTFGVLALLVLLLAPAGIIGLIVQFVSWSKRRLGWSAHSEEGAP
ncbi:branched-chain amino acid ABC transporter permease [Pseudochelatococcus sp. G4_1912]|uniref:branched-chain amino acid ABC transporter permease n=1 Tax=Pseudochelatococcus sp. G4_1912 TaxID=3114288 RepID=UPI0039C5B8A3